MTILNIPGDVKMYTQQDWVAFMSQPYLVEVKVEVEVDIEAMDDLRLGLI